MSQRLKVVRQSYATASASSLGDFIDLRTRGNAQIFEHMVLRRMYEENGTRMTMHLVGDVDLPRDETVRCVLSTHRSSDVNPWSWAHSEIRRTTARGSPDA